MGIDFEHSNPMQQINFGDVAVLKNLTTKTFCFDIVPETVTDDFNVLFDVNASSAAGVSHGYFTLLATGKLRFIASWDGSVLDHAIWDADTAFVAGTHYKICITYDNSSTSNNPIFYANGSSIALTETAAPAGSLSDSGGVTFFGGYVGTTNNFDGLISNIRVYNRILTAGEILDLHNGRGASHNDYGLVFHVPCISAAGIQTFDGATLTTTSYVYDRINGLKGTPAGNPLGVADTVLTYVDDH